MGYGISIMYFGVAIMFFMLSFQTPTFLIAAFGFMGAGIMWFLTERVNRGSKRP